MSNIFALSSIVAVVTLILTKSELFETVRTAILERSWFFGKLFNCAFCTSVWISFALSFLFGLHIVEYAPVVDQVLSAFVLVAIACPIMYVVFKSIEEI